MQKGISTTVTANSLGHPAGTKLFRVASGTYAGRRVAVYQPTASEIMLVWSDTAGDSWSTPLTLATDASDNPFDAVLAASGDLHVFYTENGTNALVTKKCTFSAGTWTPGTKIIVYSVNPAIRPRVIIDPYGAHWVSWIRQQAGLEYVHVKSSTDGGVSWGSGASDGGDVLTPGTGAAYGTLIARQSTLHAIYTSGGSKIATQSRALPSGTWSAETVIATGLNFDQHFDCAVSSGGLLGVAYDIGDLRFREYDGAVWTAAVVFSAAGGSYPQVRYVDNVPVIYFIPTTTTDQSGIQYVERRSGSFSSPLYLDARANRFDRVTLFHAGTASYANKSDEAYSATAADVFHTGSGKLLLATGDRLFLGMVERFRYAKVLLATPGSGGSVTYSYWDGSLWQPFTPAAGNFAFDSADKDVAFWVDYASIPNSWQKTQVNGEEFYWIRIEVTAPFTTGPVASQMTAISDVRALSVGRG